MGPDQHAQLDRFSLFLPFPYRGAVILVAGKPRDTGALLMLDSDDVDFNVQASGVGGSISNIFSRRTL